MNTKNLLLLALIGVTLSACKKDKEEDAPAPTPVNEEELITTVLLTFTDSENASNIFVLRWEDLDGDGGNAPVITGDTLPNNRAFNLAVRVLNESVVPVDEITDEVAAEGEEHQFFFESLATTLVVTYNDTDAGGAPIGLSNVATTGALGVGSLKVTLRHEPNKGAAGVANGDITNAGGETDIEVTFPVVVE